MARGSLNTGEGFDESEYLKAETLAAAGGVATLDGDGKLTESQRPAVDCYTKAETDGKISAAVSGHNAAEDAHAAIQNNVQSLLTKIKALELRVGTNVSGNAFTVEFNDLDDVTATGAWNTVQARIEF